MLIAEEYPHNAIERYLGPSEGFQYLLRQENFAIEFTNDEWLHTALTKLWIATPDTMAAARLALSKGPDFRGIARHRLYPESHNMTFLHIMVQILNTPRSFQRSSESIKCFISDILAAGADIHALTLRGCTPFGLLLSGQYLHPSYFNDSISTWLQVV